VVTTWPTPEVADWHRLDVSVEEPAPGGTIRLVVREGSGLELTADVTTASVEEDRFAIRRVADEFFAQLRNPYERMVL
jgi:hypothetical protein